MEACVSVFVFVGCILCSTGSFRGPRKIFDFWGVLAGSPKISDFGVSFGGFRGSCLPLKGEIEGVSDKRLAENARDICIFHFFYVPLRAE